MTPLAQAVWPTLEKVAVDGPVVPIGRDHVPLPVNTPAAAHASSLLAMPAAHLSAVMAFWFAGTHESTADVQIAASSKAWCAFPVVGTCCNPRC